MRFGMGISATTGRTTHGRSTYARSALFSDTRGRRGGRVGRVFSACSVGLYRVRIEADDLVPI